MTPTWFMECMEYYQKNYQEEGKQEEEENPEQEETDTPLTWLLECIDNFENKMAAPALDIMIKNRLEA